MSLSDIGIRIMYKKRYRQLLLLTLIVFALFNFYIYRNNYWIFNDKCLVYIYYPVELIGVNFILSGYDVKSYLSRYPFGRSAYAKKVWKSCAEHAVNISLFFSICGFVKVVLFSDFNLIKSFILLADSFARLLPATLLINSITLFLWHLNNPMICDNSTLIAWCVSYLELIILKKIMLRYSINYPVMYGWVTYDNSIVAYAVLSVLVIVIYVLTIKVTACKKEYL